jgi:hypothetical protein
MTIYYEKYGINTRKIEKDIDTPFPNEIYSFGCTLRCRLLLMLRNTTDVFRKTTNFDVWQMVDPIKVGVGLSGTNFLVLIPYFLV